MRFMLMEKAGAPGAVDVAWRARYGQALVRAGVLLAAERLRPGAGGHQAEVAGFWLIEVKSRQEADEWARRSGQAGRIEVREVIQAGENDDAVPDPVQGR